MRVFRLLSCFPLLCGCSAVLRSPPFEPQAEPQAESSVESWIARVRENPSRFSGPLNKLLAGHRGELPPLLRDLALEFRAYDKGTAGENASLALNFDYAREWEIGEERSSFGTPGSHLSVDLSAKGAAAFDRDSNPEDFLQARIAFSGFRDNGASDPVDYTAVRDQLVGMREELPGASPERKVQILAELEALEKRLADEQGRAAGLEYTLWWSGHAGFESNQRFTARNRTFGFTAIADLKSYDDDHWLSDYNFFDYPFALLRCLVGGDPHFSPRGSAFPTLRVGVDRVDPEGQGPRAVVGDDTDFTRLMGEVAMRTPVVRYTRESKVTLVDLSLSYRYFYELDPSAAVEAAELDRFGYLAVRVSTSDGYFVTYRTGQLPFDVGSDNTVELGWQSNF